MIQKKPRQKKYFAPQNEGHQHQCDFPGCNKAGEYRAPKDRKLKEYYWFCLEHVQEYNAKWNYYEHGEEEEEKPKHTRSHPHFRNFGAGVRYSFGYSFKDSFEFFDEYEPDFANQHGDVYFSELEFEYLKIMELKPHDVSVDSLKKQYKKLVKKYHPDLNPDNKEAEENFKKLSVAYHHLLDKFS